MNINLTGQGLELTDSLRSFVKEKFSRITRHSDNVTAIHVVLSTENKRQTADATLQISHAKDVHAESTTEDMYASIDDVVSKVERMLVKLKEKSIAAQRNVSKDLNFEEKTD